MVYIESMGKTLLNLFKSYSSQLLKLDLTIMSKTDLIAVEDAAMKSMFMQKVRARILVVVELLQQ
jgi:hypothetical protein